MLKIVERTKLWFGISLALLAIGAIFLILNKGLNKGVDFSGGTVVRIELGEASKTANKADIDEIINKYSTGTPSRTVNDTQIEIQSNVLDNKKANDLFREIKQKYSLKDTALVDVKHIDASIGRETTRNAVIALLVAGLFMVIYIRLRFKDVKFGLAAIIALLHDVLITMSLYAVLRISINASFIAAILTIVGYSINDTIVIFDRIRENSRKLRGKTVAEIADISVNQSLKRSIKTSVTTLLTITAVYIFVPSVRDFSLPIIAGIIAGTYSSIFIASPLWVIFNNIGKKKKVAAV
ncbi:MAG: protein translocase subunit SecF [Clostridia bacterium]|nr:protein translocase subunit SecF [Clostridia bacterium]